LRFQPGYFFNPSNWPWGTPQNRLHFKPWVILSLYSLLRLKMWYVL
jgi:hypothetical protein